MSTITYQRLYFAGIVLAASSVVHCSYDDQCGDWCEYGSAGTGGDAGSSGASGSSGSGGKGGGSSGSGGKGGASGGTDSGSGGTAGAQGGEPNGGSAGTSSLPCDGACGSSKPFCKQSTDTCVECLKDADCDGDKPFCDTTANECVACLDNEDCDDPTASKCEAGQCVGCGDSAECSHISGKTACDTSASECVQCTGTDYSACGESEGTPLVCDSLSRTCTTKKQHTAGLCIPCVSDAECKPGQMCVLQKYGEQDVGHFCFWKQGGGSGAPTDCFATGRPYVGLVEDAISIDGVTADICGLRASTCAARNEFSMKDCATAALPDDSKCSFAPPGDSKCVQASPTVYRCTMRCLSNDDCPDPSTCDTEADPPVCRF
jgi:hypothetical protein